MDKPKYKTSDECVFCQIVAGKLPCHKIWEDEEHLAFLSIFPNTDGTSVVVTKDHNPSYVFENTDEVIANLMIATKKVAAKLDRVFEDVARTGLICEGFGVDHLHSKLYPMHGTANLEAWKPIESKQEVYFEEYAGYLSSHDGERMDDKILEVLAKKIRETKTD